MAVRDYSKGKVYKIVVDTEEEYKPYVGSTIQGLAERMGGHRSNYKRWKEEETTLCSSFELFDKFGITKCKIILLEEYPCDSKMKLLMKEREWFDKIECCNKTKPLRKEEEKTTQYIYQRHLELNPNDGKDRYQKSIEKNPNIGTEHYQRQLELHPNFNQERYQNKILKNPNIGKETYEKYKDKINENRKIKYQTNRDEILQKSGEKNNCECGGCYTNGNKSTHNKTMKHQNYLSSLKV